MHDDNLQYAKGIFSAISAIIIIVVFYCIGRAHGKDDGRLEACEWVGGKGTKFKDGEGCIR